MCTLASPSHFRFSDSPPLSARSVLATRVYSFYFLERNDQQNYRVLPYFCLMDGLSDVRITPLMIGDVLYLEPFCWHVVKDLIHAMISLPPEIIKGIRHYTWLLSGGYLAVAEILILASPSLASFTNNYGDTFLHMAVSGFQTPGFRRVDRQIELFTQSVSGKIVNFKGVANVKNNDGRTALHTINQLNISDMEAMTPLELLKQQPRSASSETLIKQLISAGGISCRQDNIARNVIVSHLNGHGIGMSPGTSF
ncbi:ANKYRIN REPEAT AND PROTEIN KINASE DOMAIN-CONTAINING PROTEIN 1-LIKE [Salix purpurea]|uniref:ANKYRIN REPEAT AND PROTEIN KINASE DOMAIN-CONTAINING PROTEIN 1-LIKE n=1 Tax=Salix purpurea TaxID=77065 RepID=A0A9Q0Z2U3_SALPP|nr:ANKYRIN REPEAT AND PROTEIN KINASE DOMAIN-CONTAINING PROTEIN 1-LIKE [Salix purpurea]